MCVMFVERGPSGAEWHGARPGCRLPAGYPRSCQLCTPSRASKTLFELLHIMAHGEHGLAWMLLDVGDTRALETSSTSMAQTGEARRTNPGRGRSWSQVSLQASIGTPSSGGVSCPPRNYAEGQGKRRCTPAWGCIQACSIEARQANSKKVVGPLPC